jgi:hypothetical protein
MPPRLRLPALALVAAAIAFAVGFMIAGAGGAEPDTASAPSATPAEFEAKPASATVSALGAGGRIPDLPRERRTGGGDGEDPVATPTQGEPTRTATATPGTVTPPSPTPVPPTPQPPRPTGTPF